jgi:hypothetical protein
MLAHISPVEAQILRRYGGSGTINPTTGMPEFFLKKMFKKLGKAVKKFANTTIGKIVIGTALFMVAGPAAASMLGASAGGAAAAGISGFVSGAGTSLLAGGNLKDSLKAGAIGGITAGVSKGVMNRMGTPAAAAAETAKLPNIGTAPAADTGVRTFGLGEQTPITRTPMGATLPNPSIGSFADFTADLTPGGPSLAQQAAPQKIVSAIPPVTQFELDRAIQLPIRPSASPVAAAQRAAPSLNAPGTGVLRPELMGSDAASLTAQNMARGVQGGVQDNAQRGIFQQGLDKVLPNRIRDAGPAKAIDKVARDFQISPERVRAALVDGSSDAISTAYQAALPGTISTYAPLAATGLGIMALTGGFDQEEVAPP